MIFQRVLQRPRGANIIMSIPGNGGGEYTNFGIARKNHGSRARRQIQGIFEQIAEAIIFVAADGMMPM